MIKYGPIKRRHGRIPGLDAILDRIVRECPHVTRIIPGRMGAKRGKTPGGLKIQYETTRGGDAAKAPSGLKCIYTRQGNWQEVFLVCSDTDQARQWLENSNLTDT